MHIFFTDEERKWIKIDTFGYPIKDNCPEKIKRSIKNKKRALNGQTEIITNGGHRSKG